MFLMLVMTIVLLSIREWIALLRGQRSVALCESPPVWLPDYAVKETGQNLRPLAGAVVLTIVLAKELSGEASIERARKNEIACDCKDGVHSKADMKSEEQLYLEMTEQRFNGVRRCC
jgi:hypothetical protein